VLAAYQAATGAPPAFAQYSAALTAVRTGAQTVPGLYLSLVGPDTSADATTLTRLYQNLLNRAPTPIEILVVETGSLADAFEALIGYPASITITAPIGSPANEFQSTGPFHTTLAADHTNGLYIRMLYYVILGRAPDLGGLEFWLGVANSGGPGILFQGRAGFPTRIQILGNGVPLQGFIGSPEFLCPIIQ